MRFQFFFLLTLSYFAVPIKAHALTPAPLVTAMDKLYADLQTLVPYLFSAAAFEDAKNTPTISKTILHMSDEAIHTEHQKHFKNNPSGALALKVLNGQLTEARRSFTRGRKEYSRTVLQGAVQMCATCHTSGFNNRPLLTAENESVLKHLKNDLDRGQYFMATRRFNDAEAAFKNLLQTANPAQAPVLQMEEALHLLATLYAKLDPRASAGHELFQRLSQQLKNPPLKELAIAYAASFLEWKNEKSPPPQSATELLSWIQRTIKWSADQPLLSYEDTLTVPKLRAASLLSQLSTQKISREQHAQVLHHLGLIYNSLSKKFFLELDHTYFTLCIDQAPRTKTSKQCYQSLEAALRLDSTGSSGVHLDASDATLLKVYKKKAMR